jgi:hypothetical protein
MAAVVAEVELAETGSSYSEAVAAGLPAGNNGDGAVTGEGTDEGVDLGDDRGVKNSRGVLAPPRFQRSRRYAPKMALRCLSAPTV